MWHLKQPSNVISMCLNPKCFLSGCETLIAGFYLPHRCNCLSVGLQQVNIISVTHTNVSISIYEFVIFKMFCTLLLWLPSRTPSQSLLLQCSLIQKVSMYPHVGVNGTSLPLPRAPQHQVVVSCGEEGVKGLTAGGLFRQDSCGV